MLLTYLFLAVVAYFAYMSYVRPYVSSLRSISKDTALNGHLSVVNLCQQFDYRSHQKAVSNVKGFMITYSNTFKENEDVLSKMKKQKFRVMKYLNRIPLRMQNDANLEHSLQNSIQSIDGILENYLTEAHDRRGKYHFS